MEIKPNKETNTVKQMEIAQTEITEVFFSLLRAVKESKELERFIDHIINLRQMERTLDILQSELSCNEDEEREKEEVIADILVELCTRYTTDEIKSFVEETELFPLLKQLFLSEQRKFEQN